MGRSKVANNEDNENISRWKGIKNNINNINKSNEIAKISYFS